MRAFVVVAALAVSACAPADLTLRQNASPEVQRALATLQDTPFDTGPVTVLVEEHGELHTYTLAPCRGDTRICAGSTRGRAGSAVWEEEHLVVRGAYAGRTFHLSPGGDGFMSKAGVSAPLAWDDASPRTRWAQTLVTDQGVGLQQATAR